MSMAEGDVPTPTPPPSEGRRTWPIELVKVLALPLVTLVLGYWFNSSLNERQQIDNNVRLYAEMMGRREEADSNLRKDMLCYAACPIYGLDPKFIGPAAIALAQRYNLDSRDEGASERLEILSEHEGIWGCTFVGECTKVCPKNVNPAGAIQRYKLNAALESVKSFFLPRGA